MGSHPINLLLRFLLEISALVSVGMWGWQQSDGWLRYVPGIGLPILMAVVWGVFAVPNDPGRSGAAPVVTPGLVRLLLELAMFAFATWCLKDLAYNKSSLVFGLIVVMHYVVSYDRILWLLRQ